MMHGSAPALPCAPEARFNHLERTRMSKSLLQRPSAIGTLVLFMMASACASDPSMAPVGAPPAGDLASSSLVAQIRSEIGDAACDGPQQCRSIAVGAKSCGGPEGYLAWSGKRTDEQRLKSLVEKHAASRKEENQRSGMLSTCVFETDPGATCQAGRCILGPRGPGAASGV